MFIGLTVEMSDEFLMLIRTETATKVFLIREAIMCLVGLQGEIHPSLKEKKISFGLDEKNKVWRIKNIFFCEAWRWHHSFTSSRQGWLLKKRLNNKLCIIQFMFARTELANQSHKLNVKRK